LEGAVTAGAERDPLLTLEPLIDAVRDGVEAAGWTLSGLQKTTSEEFEGRWQGQSTRSAYLFFHRDSLGDDVSVDVYLDETSSGLQGNLALVVEAPPLSALEPVSETLADLGRAASGHLPAGYRTPVSIRARLDGAGSSPREADVEVRIKLRIPRGAVEAGASAVSALATSSVRAFERLLADPELRRYVNCGEDRSPGRNA
jgi:hypothetical protein